MKILSEQWEKHHINDKFKKIMDMELVLEKEKNCHRIK